MEPLGIKCCNAELQIEGHRVYVYVCMYECVCLASAIPI